MMSPNTPPSPQLADLLPGYERYLVGEKRRPAGVKRYLWAMGYVIDFLREQRRDEPTVADLTPAAVRRLKEACGARGLANGTIVNLLAVIRDFSRWCVQEDLRSDDPTLGIKRPVKKRPDPNPLYPHEVLAVIAAISAPPPAHQRREREWRRSRLAILIFLYTGLRISELAALRWGDVDLTAKVLRVVEGKGGKTRSIPLHEVLADELRRVPLHQRKSGRAVIDSTHHRAGRPISAKSLAHIFERWLPARLADAGLDMHIWAHRLRHTFASTLVWSDVDLRTVQELLGHAQLGTTEHYVQVDQRQKRRAIGKLDYTKPIDAGPDEEA